MIYRDIQSSSTLVIYKIVEQVVVIKKQDIITQK